MARLLLGCLHTVIKHDGEGSRFHIFISTGATLSAEA